MNRTRGPSFEAADGVPRASGDEPIKLAATLNFSACSPRERG